MITIAPVRKQVTVTATQQRAFALFTNEMSRWWPATHSILKSPLKQYVVEPRVGGRWYAVAEDGSTGETGYVIEWQPPQRLVALTLVHRLTMKACTSAVAGGGPL